MTYVKGIIGTVTLAIATILVVVVVMSNPSKADQTTSAQPARIAARSNQGLLHFRYQRTVLGKFAYQTV